MTHELQYLSRETLAQLVFKFAVHPRFARFSHSQMQNNLTNSIDDQSNLCQVLLISIISCEQMSMGFKQTTRSPDFADLALATCQEQNRSIKHMEPLSNSINWVRVESILAPSIPAMASCWRPP